MTVIPLVSDNLAHPCIRTKILERAIRAYMKGQHSPGKAAAYKAFKGKSRNVTKA